MFDLFEAPVALAMARSKGELDATEVPKESKAKES